MKDLTQTIDELKIQEKEASLRFFTLGDFTAYLDKSPLSAKDWGRDKSIQLIQYFIVARDRHALHKEKIISRLWEDADDGDRDFKVALHGINKAIEPNKKRGDVAKFIHRNGVSYHLDLSYVWLDAEAFDQAIKIGNHFFNSNTQKAKEAFSYAIDLYRGSFLPNRIYEDWTSMERERLQLLAINAMIALGEFNLSVNPSESIRLAQEVLQIDHAWEEAYRLQMQAYSVKGNRPQIIKTYQRCEGVLQEEFGIPPLPETRSLMLKIMEN